MWTFVSPRVVFGEGALSHLSRLHGERAFMVTDKMMVQLGFAELVKEQLDEAGMSMEVFDEVEPEPSLETVLKGAQQMREYEPDWIIGLGGGSAMDAAKAMWALYERPDLSPDAINPLEELGIGKKAKLIAISTTSGTGAEVTWAVVLTDKKEQRKLGLGSMETLPTIAIVDPIFAEKMPPQLTADSGLDALTHAIEGFTGTWHNDFSDGLCLKAIDLVFRYLPRSFRDASDVEARTAMHNAAAIAGLGFINSLTSMAHATGHSFGAAFGLPHGRCTGLFLPYTMEFAATHGQDRFAAIARSLDMVSRGEGDKVATWKLIDEVRSLEAAVKAPACALDLAISRDAYGAAMDRLIDFAQNDTSIVSAPRVPERHELERLFWHVYDGKRIDF